MVKAISLQARGVEFRFPDPMLIQKRLGGLAVTLKLRPKQFGLPDYPYW